MSEPEGYCMCGAAICPPWNTLHRPGCPTRDQDWESRKSQYGYASPMQALWRAYAGDLARDTEKRIVGTYDAVTETSLSNHGDNPG